MTNADPVPARLAVHTLLFTLFLWLFPGTLRAVELEGTLLVAAGLVAYPSLLAAHLVRTRLDHGDGTAARWFVVHWIIGFPLGVIVVNLFLVRALLSPDPIVEGGGLLRNFVPEYGRFVVQGKVAQIVYSALLAALANSSGVLWVVFTRRSPTATTRE